MDDSTGEDSEYQMFISSLSPKNCQIFIVNMPDLGTFGPLEGIWIPKGAPEEEKQRFSHWILDTLAQIAVRGSTHQDLQKKVFIQRVQNSINAEMDDIEDFEN